MKECQGVGIHRRKITITSKRWLRDGWPKIHLTSSRPERNPPTVDKEKKKKVSTVYWKVYINIQHLTHECNYWKWFSFKTLYHRATLFGKYFGKENIYKIYLVLMFISKGKRSQYWGVQYRLNSTKYSSPLNEKY